MWAIFLKRKKFRRKEERESKGGEKEENGREEKYTRDITWQILFRCYFFHCPDWLSWLFLSFSLSEKKKRSSRTGTWELAQHGRRSKRKKRNQKVCKWFPTHEESSLFLSFSFSSFISLSPLLSLFLSTIKWNAKKLEKERIGRECTLWIE